jgi:hypothetical protein
MSRQPISVKRILLALIAVFAATSLVSLAFMSLMGIPSALLWHIQRGNTIAVEGHTFRIPLLLAPESGTKPGDITLLATHPIRGGLEAISISKTGKPSSEAGNIARIQKLIRSTTLSNASRVSASSSPVSAKIPTATSKTSGVTQQIPISRYSRWPPAGIATRCATC